MSRTEQKSASIDEALEQARIWEGKGIPLLLSISDEPERRAVSDKLAGRLSYVAEDGTSLKFDWQIVESDPKVSAKPLVDGGGHFVIWLVGSSFSITDSPRKSMTISRGSYRYVVTEYRASDSVQG